MSRVCRAHGRLARSRGLRWYHDKAGSQHCWTARLRSPYCTRRPVSGLSLVKDVSRYSCMDRHGPLAFFLKLPRRSRLTNTRRVALLAPLALVIRLSRECCMGCTTKPGAERQSWHLPWVWPPRKFKSRALHISHPSVLQVVSTG